MGTAAPDWGVVLSSKGQGLGGSVQCPGRDPPHMVTATCRMNAVDTVVFALTPPRCRLNDSGAEAGTHKGVLVPQMFILLEQPGPACLWLLMIGGTTLFVLLLVLS